MNVEPRWCAVEDLIRVMRQRTMNPWWPLEPLWSAVMVSEEALQWWELVHARSNAMAYERGHTVRLNAEPGFLARKKRERQLLEHAMFRDASMRERVLQEVGYR